MRAINRLGYIGCVLAFGIAASTTAWGQFPADSLTIQKAISLAISNSIAVQGAEQNIEAARARTRQAESARYPHVEADLSYRRVDPTISVDFPINGTVEEFSFFPNDNYEAAVTANQTIYDFGKTSAAEELARSGEVSAEQNEESVKMSIAYQTVDAFNRTLLLQRNIKVIDDQITVLGENLRLANERQDQGTATSYDVLSTQVRLTTVQNQRIDVEGTLHKQEALLRRLLGAPAGTPLRLAGNFESPEIGVSEDSLVAIALRTRPEIVGARDAATTAQLQIDVARAGDNPLLSLNVTGGVKNGFPPDLIAPKLNWAGTIRLSVPIFDGSRTEAMEAEAEANHRAAQARLSDLERNVTMEVEQALTDVQTSSQKIQSADLLVSQAREALELARTRYKFGTITNLELLNAQTTLQEAEFQRLQYQYNLALSQYSLEHALGRKIW